MNSDLIELLRHMDESGVRFLVVGGYAVIHHTEPRYTKDIDLLVSTDAKNAQRVFNVLKNFGAPLEGLTAESFQDDNSFFMMGRDPNRIDILMGIPGIDFEAAWQNRDVSELRGIKLNFIGLDDLITAKTAAGRDQDLIDVKALKLRKAILAREKQQQPPTD